MTILSFISLAMKAAPTVEQVFTDGKQLVVNLFESGMITKQQQDDTLAWANAHQAAVLAGNEPPEFTVE